MIYVAVVLGLGAGAVLGLVLGTAMPRRCPHEPDCYTCRMAGLRARAGIVDSHRRRLRMREED